MPLVQDELKTIFRYNPETGVLSWREGRSNVLKGATAGCKNGSGYMVVTINSKSYRVQRVIWIYLFGHIPSGYYIDHINGNKSDNRLCNLRLATNGQNQQNRSIPKNNSSGYRGVTWHKQANKWMARICIDRKRETLGFFESAEEAYAAYKARASQMYTHADRLP